MAVYQGILYTKTIKCKNGTSFPQWLFKVKGTTFQAQLSNDCKKKLGLSLLQSPYLLTIEEDDYFVKAVKYENSKGEENYKDVIVLLNYNKVEQATFEKTTLEDVLKSKQPNEDITAVDVKPEDLPF